MELIRVSDRVWYSMYEAERDRPCLGYVRGNRWSLAVDAGHSDAHVEEFYDALSRVQLPLSSVTVVTHWHWDHAFGIKKPAPCLQYVSNPDFLMRPGDSSFCSGISFPNINSTGRFAGDRS